MAAVHDGGVAGVAGVVRRLGGAARRVGVGGEAGLGAGVDEARGGVLVHGCSLERGTFLLRPERFGGKPSGLQGLFNHILSPLAKYLWKS